MIYDVGIIGTGPAGLSAALNLKILKKEVLWIGNKNGSDKVTKAEQILNYPGLPRVSGKELNDSFNKSIEDMNLQILDKMVGNIMKFGDHYAIMAASDMYEVKSIIFATGVGMARTLPGEDELVGKGVSYCATCDGSLYKGKKIAVICGNQRFEHEVKYLAEIADKVYFVPLYKNPSVSGENIVTLDAKVKSINKGERNVESVTLTNSEKLSIDGVFCLRDAVSLSTLLPTLETENGHILVDRNMKTNLEGCFAAGDCTGRPYQYAKAIGEGNVAAHSVVEYLASKE